MKTYLTPLLLWSCALTGLVAALVGDGWLDGVGVALLGAPAVVTLVKTRRPAEPQI